MCGDLLVSGQVSENMIEGLELWSTSKWTREEVCYLLEETFLRSSSMEELAPDFWGVYTILEQSCKRFSRRSQSRIKQSKLEFESWVELSILGQVPELYWSFLSSLGKKNGANNKLKVNIGEKDIMVWNAWLLHHALYIPLYCFLSLLKYRRCFQPLVIYLPSQWKSSHVVIRMYCANSRAEFS